MNYNKNYVKL